jgi:hypothetical protein
MSQFLYDWQTLVAGLLGLAGGVIAYWGALLAANRQVAAIREQLGDAQQARKSAERRQTHALIWSLEIELRWLISTARLLRSALPSQPQWSQLTKANLMIGCGPLLRGERDISLLGEEPKFRLEEVARRLADYNAYIGTRPTSGEGGTLVDAEVPKRIDLIIDSADYLSGILPEEIIDPPGT